MGSEIDDVYYRALQAHAKAKPAYARLVSLAEDRNSGQIPRVARFLASTYNGSAFPLDLFELRALDVEIGDDMLTCIDALRWGVSDLYKLVPDGERRLRAIIDLWGIQWPLME